MEFRQQSGNAVIEIRRKHADAQSAPLRFAQIGNRIFGVLQIASDLGAVLKQQRTRLGQRDFFAQPIEQRRIQLVLQRANLLAERRLGNSDPLRRLGKVHFLAHGHKILKLPDFQQESPLYHWFYQ